MAKDLSSVAMVVSLGFSAYGASKKDKERSKELTEANGAAKNRARVEKKLIDVKNEKSFAALKNHRAAVRAYHNNVTLPWFDDGSRILPVSKLEEYSAFMRQARETDAQLVSDFVKEYPAIVLREQARYTALGGLWNADDYLPASEIRAKFDFRLSIFPLPRSNDFRVQVRSDEIDELRKQYEESFSGLLKKARKEMFERLYETVKTLADNIRQPDKVFKQASIDNVTSLCDLLEDLNIEKSSEIEAMRNRIKSMATVEASKLREDKPFRAEVSKEADKILEDLAGYLA